MTIKLIYRGEPHVILNVSETAGDAMLDTIAGLMDGGRIELLSTDDSLIATLQLANPVAEPALGGQIEFNPIRASVAVSGGEAQTARVVGATGAEVFLCDVSDLAGDGVIKLSTTQIDAGQPVRIHSFTLTMP